MRVPVTILSILEEVDSANYGDLLNAGESSIEDGARYLVLDMTNMPHISSAGLRVIHSLLNILHRIHTGTKMTGVVSGSPYLKVANLVPRVLDVFRLSGFDLYIEIHPSIESALNSFSPPAAGRITS